MTVILNIFFIKFCCYVRTSVNIELIREYALRIAVKFANDASSGVQTDCYLKHSLERQAFWRNIAQLPPDSEHWKHVRKYFSLICDSKATQSETRALYNFLREKFDHP